MRAILVLACLGFLFAAGCSDDNGVPDVTLEMGVDGPLPDFPPPTEMGPDMGDIIVSQDGLSCQLNVESINNRPINQWQVISTLNDQDKAVKGIQVDVVVSVIGAPDGTTITLKVDGLTPDPSAVAAGGKATFKKVTVSQSFPIVRFTPVGPPTCNSNTAAFTVVKDPKCAFNKPANGITLTANNDEVAGNGQFDYTVVVQTVDPQGGSVELSIEGGAAGSVTPNAFGTASFGQKVLPKTANSSVKLDALVKIPTPDGDVTGTCQSVVILDIDAPSCVLKDFVPAPITISIGKGLGPNQDADPGTVGFQTNLTVDTETGVDDVRLTITYGGGSTVTYQASSVTGNTASFNVIDVKEGLNTNFQATCKNTSTGNSSNSNKLQVTVDVTAPPAVPAKSVAVPGGLECWVSHNRKGEITCTFASVDDGANGSGVEKYLVRYRKNSLIDATNFDSADTLMVQPDPPAVPAGSVQTVVSKLTMGDTFDFAVKGIDLLGNVSAISEDVPAAKVDFDVQQIVGANPGDAFGYPVTVGDFNCDGYTDVAVGLNNANGTKGEVQIFFSNGATPLGPLPASYSKKISGTITSGYLGIKLAALNFDNDPNNCTDLAVRAGGQDGKRGRVYVYLGRSVWADREDETVGKGAEIMFALPSTAGATERLGYSIGAADITGDGIDDLAMTHWIEDGTKWATLLVAYGKTNIPLMGAGVSPQVRELPTTVDLQVTGGSRADRFGWSLERGGLLNTDTNEELVFGAPDTLVGGQKQGMAYVLLGQAAAATSPEVVSLSTSTRVLTVQGSTGNVAFGSPVAGIGDTNGDGVAEFAVSDIYAPVGTYSGAGAVYVFDLSGSAPTSAADAKAVISNDLDASATSNAFGRSLANGATVDPTKGADVNADGLGDLLVGMWKTGSQLFGSAYLFHGVSGAHVDSAVSKADYVFTPGTGGTLSFSLPVLLTGDINGDGYSDIVISEANYSSNAGRILIQY